MLDVSNSASEAIDTLTSSAGNPAYAGIRISVAATTAQGADLAVTVMDRPVDGDQVVAGPSGSQVFLAPEAAPYLDDKVLDAHRGGDGLFRFTLHGKA